MEKEGQYYRGNLFGFEMGPRVKFVSAILDTFSEKNGGQFFSLKKDQTRGGGPRGVWQKTTLFPDFFSAYSPNYYYQVRLNFEEVELLDPDSTGACRTDYMHVTGGVSQVPNYPI